MCRISKKGEILDGCVVDQPLIYECIHFLSLLPVFRNNQKVFSSLHAAELWHKADKLLVLVWQVLSYLPLNEAALESFGCDCSFIQRF